MGGRNSALSSVGFSRSDPHAHTLFSQSSSSLLAQAGQGGYESRHHRQPRDRERERERAERHAQRAAAAAAAAANAANANGTSSPVAPSPALVRDGSKMGRNPAGSAVPGPNSSAMAIKGVLPAGGAGGKRGSGQQTHPYASAGGQAGYDRGDSEYGAGGYRSGQATPAAGMSTTGAQAHGAGVTNGDYHEEEQKGGFSLIKLLTCRCG